MITVDIVYSSVGGNTKLVCDSVQEVLQKNNLLVSIRHCQTTSAENIQSSDIIILACPTYGQGTIEADFADFLNRISEHNWSNQNFAIIGLGDIKYYPEYLTEATGLLLNWVNEQGGAILGQPFRLGQPPLKFIDSMVKRWAEKLVDEIKTINF